MTRQVDHDRTRVRRTYPEVPAPSSRATWLAICWRYIRGSKPQLFYANYCVFIQCALQVLDCSSNAARHHTKNECQRHWNAHSLYVQFEYCSMSGTSLCNSKHCMMCKLKVKGRKIRVVFDQLPTQPDGRPRRAYRRPGLPSPSNQ